MSDYLRAFLVVGLYGGAAVLLVGALLALGSLGLLVRYRPTWRRK